ncbi:transcription factor grauzone-like [Cochliomyia hominivorax]
MLCFICLSEAQKFLSVSDNVGKPQSIADIISKHLWFKVNDILTSHICNTCWNKIYDFHEFYETVEKLHKEFQNVQQDLDILKEEDDNKYINPESIKNELVDDDENCINEEKNLQLEIEIDLEEVNNIRNPLEEVMENESMENTYDEEDGDYSNDDDNTSTSSEEYESNIKELVEENKEKKTRNNDEKPKRCRRKKSEVEKTEDNPPRKRKKAIFNRLDPVHTEEMILKHIPMGCNLCVFVGKTFGDIVKHFKADHPDVRPYITCCDKTFTKRFYVAQHAMTHENPDCFSCNLCNKSFTTTGGLQKHNLKYHAPEEELTFACDLCPQKFARQHLLQLHKPSHIPREEWNFYCTKCPTEKVFASAYLLNIHDSKLHRREKNICNVCAKEIKDKKSFEKHVKEHYNGSGPRIKCPLPNCDSWLKDEDSLKVHLRRHNTDNETYKCPLCDKICPNRRALSSHKVYVHSKAAFKCDHCDKTFKRAITLREHMTQHTGEVLYSCPFCPRTFNSNANMHSHKKKQHPVEWAALRKQKMCSNPAETNNSIDISDIL